MIERSLYSARPPSLFDVFLACQHALFEQPNWPLQDMIQD
jgi:hypothetical protein